MCRMMKVVHGNGIGVEGDDIERKFTRYTCICSD